MNDSINRAKTVAITGATGLLGRYLSDYFYAKGWRVNALVRDVSKYPFKEQGINTFTCILPDTVDTKSIESADVLIHCAYMTRFTNLEEAKKVNEDGMTMILKEARKAGVRRFVFISSRAARPNAHSYYAQSKYKLETMLDPSRDLIVRPGFILAGDGGLFYRIVNQVKRLPVVPVFGGGHQRLNTIHIEDLCKILEWALEKDICGVITVAEPEGITMKELLSVVLDQLGQNKMILSVPGRPIIRLLQLLETFKLKLPVSSENLRGLLNREDMGETCSDSVRRSGIDIRHARESIRSLIHELK
jgi:nucleoside-diphosphate-sugar epimerase